MRTTTLLVAVLALFPTLVQAQDTQASARGAAAADARGSTAATARSADAETRIDAALATAAEAGIPLQLLERKRSEGRAKGIPMERIAAAMELRLAALLRAREAMQRAGVESTSSGELLIASEALQAGVSEAAVVKIAQTHPQERRAVATAVLTDLVRLGIETGPAYARVQAALSSGPEALANLRAEAAASLRARGKVATDLEGLLGQ